MIRVMVVDDSPLVRKIVSDILNGDPQIDVVAAAASAEPALAALERESPDVIVMGLEMPGMGGLKAIGEIMRRRPTPVVVLSARTRQGKELALLALDLGAVDFVPRPDGPPPRSIDAAARSLIAKVRGACGAGLLGARAKATLRNAGREEP
jgi:two-component system chemotaxis response regulator CheB